MTYRKRLTYLLFFVVANTTAAPANPKGRSMEFGTWQFSSITTGRGTHFCGVLNGVTNKHIGQNIVIKGSPGSGNLVIGLYKDKWNRQQGTNVNVMFDFMNNQPVVFSAIADAHILDIELPVEHTADLLLDLSEQPALQVIFPDDEEDTWVVNTKGARDAIKKMVSCLRLKK